jgi:sugar phosphate isomerase/epimerase
MKRRNFLKLSASAAFGAMVSPKTALGAPNPPLKRIGMSSVTFRARFAQTRIRNHPKVAELKLTEVPEYFADRFKLHNVEFWSLHFESQGPSYLEELKRKIAQSKSKLINVQIDQPYDLANADESEQQKSVAYFKTWVDSAVALGSPSVRANTGGGSFEACLKSFREIEAYTRARGILLLVENHGGLSSDPQKLVDLVKQVGSKNLEILPDYGNFSAEVRYAGLEAILPHARHLISAKTHQFAEDGSHPDFDFDRCMRLAKAAGFPGYYSAEYYDRHGKAVDYEEIADWMIARIQGHL